MDIKDIAPWELLQKKITWEQLKFIQNKKILDFGSGNGMTADHFASNNEVIAIEPDNNMIQNRFQQHKYVQINGDIKELRKLENESFDGILCHNVLEYADEREEIVKEFSRLLKKDGYLSVLKHNRAGRVMQMVVLLNNFEHANELLDGKNGQSLQFGSINYYDESELLKWAENLRIEKVLGIRTFWDLQQNQDIQKDNSWQEQMLNIEMRVSSLEEYKTLAFFRHVILRKM